jgi:thymidylate synthase
MKQYLDLIENILTNGVEKESGRENMPNTIGISDADIKMNMKDGFPLLTTKKMYWKGLVHELLWFLRGETNIRYLVDNNTNIWNKDAYRWYLKYAKAANIETPMKIEEFIDSIKTRETVGKSVWSRYGGENLLFDNLNLNYQIGDLGKVYGYQWRNQNGVDQLQDVINGLKTNPYSRYHIIDAWNKADFKDMALPPCHLLYQFIVRPLSAIEREDYYAELHQLNKEDRYEMNPNATDSDVHKIMDEQGIPRFYLDLNMYQRSVDSGLGLAYNLASMSLFLMIMGKTCNMIPGVAKWIGGDTHIYVNHVDALKEQLKREPYPLPKMKINKELNSIKDIENLHIDDFELIDYISHPAIIMELSVGL